MFTDTWQGSELQALADVSHLSVGKESNKNDKYVINNPNNSDILLEVISHKIVKYQQILFHRKTHIIGDFNRNYMLENFCRMEIIDEC
jgi:hypothetical protein